MGQNFAKIALGQNFKPQPTSNISNPANGDIYYDSTRNTFVHYNNGVWGDLQSRTDVATAASLTSAQFTAAVVQSSLVRLTGSTASTIAGLAAPADAKYLIIYNQSSALITIANQSGTEGTAANRIITPNSAPLTVSAGQSVTFGYDSSQARWIVLSTPGSGSGSGGSKNYLTQYIASTGSGAQNSGNGNFELGSAAGWDWCNVGTLTNGLPTGTPNFTSVNSNPLYSFTISTSTTVAVGDTYTNVNSGTQTFTIVTALSAQSGTVFFATGTGDPTASGTLTRATGSGTSSITFSAFTKETMSVVSSSQLSGLYSLSLATSAATVAGLGFCSDAFFIDAEDQAKVLTWKFYYQAQTNPANANWSGTSSNSFGVAVYDVTNSAWLGTTASFGMTQSSGIGYATGTFQTATTTAQLRFVVYNVNATSGAVTLYLDDFSVGPQTAPIGAPMTDWQSFTPTGSWTTNTTYTGQWSRNGGDGLYRINLALSGAPNNTQLTVNLPAGHVIDTSKIPGFAAATTIIGSAETISSSNAINVPSVVLYQTTTSVILRYIGTSSGTNPVPTSAASFSPTAPGTFASGDSVNLEFRVPIVGWSSNVQMSNDTDTRVVAMNASEPTSGSITTGAWATITGQTVNQDTHGAFNTSTGIYTVPVTGWYSVQASIEIIGTGVSSGNEGIRIQANGTAIAANNPRMTASFSTSVAYSTAITAYLTAGQTINAQRYTDRTAATYTTSATASAFSISRVSGPAVVAATESVNAGYTDTAGSSIGTGGATYTFATKVYDSHNAYSSGTYTIPVSGKYRVNAQLVTAAVTLSTTQFLTLIVRQNGTSKIQSAGLGNGASTTYYAQANGTLNCLAGDTITVFIQSSVATTANTGAALNNFFIERVGN